MLAFAKKKLTNASVKYSRNRLSECLKTAPSSHIVTRSQGGKKKPLGTQPHTDICTCPHSESVLSKTTVMNDNQMTQIQENL